MILKRALWPYGNRPFVPDIRSGRICQSVAGIEHSDAPVHILGVQKKRHVQEADIPKSLKRRQEQTTRHVSEVVVGRYCRAMQAYAEDVALRKRRASCASNDLYAVRVHVLQHY